MGCFTNMFLYVCRETPSWLKVKLPTLKPRSSPFTIHNWKLNFSTTENHSNRWNVQSFFFYTNYKFAFLEGISLLLLLICTVATLRSNTVNVWQLVWVWLTVCSYFRQRLKFWRRSVQNPYRYQLFKGFIPLKCIQISNKWVFPVFGH